MAVPGGLQRGQGRGGSCKVAALGLSPGTRGPGVEAGVVLGRKTAPATPFQLCPPPI